MTIRWKDEARLRHEFDEKIHPDVRTTLVMLDRWTEKQRATDPKFPDVTVTMLGRTIAEQRVIYVTFWESLLAALEPGDFFHQVEENGHLRRITADELKIAGALKAKCDAAMTTTVAPGDRLDPDQRDAIRRKVLEPLADAKFSWHLVWCAADLRTRHYTANQLAQVVAYLEPRLRRPMHEFLVHDITAPHMHIGRRDFGWRSKYAGGALIA